MPDIYQVNESYRNKLRYRENAALSEMSRTYGVLQADNLKRLEAVTAAIEEAQAAGEDISGLSEYMLRLEALNVQMAEQVALFAPQATDIATNGQRHTAVAGHSGGSRASSRGCSFVGVAHR
jgi:hypothetical protein